jgi:hypothetical protein
VSDTSYLTSRNNRFTNNNYTFNYGTTSFRPFKWGTGTLEVSTWKNKGMDKTGTFTWK